MPWESLAEKSPSSGKTCGHFFCCIATADIPLCNEKQPVKILSSSKRFISCMLFPKLHLASSLIFLAQHTFKCLETLPKCGNKLPINNDCSLFVYLQCPRLCCELRCSTPGNMQLMSSLPYHRHLGALLGSCVHTSPHKTLVSVAYRNFEVKQAFLGKVK